MFTVLVIIHLFVSIFLIFIVLIQGGKGAEIGAAFGGSTQTIFGSRGAATFLSKVTTMSAIIFMLTSLSLAVLSSKKESVISVREPVKTSPVKPLPEDTPEPLPAIPEQSPVQEKPSQPAK